MKRFSCLILSLCISLSSFFIVAQDYSQTSNLDYPFSPTNSDVFGSSVAIDGSIAVVGASGSSARRVFIYELQSGAWTRIAFLQGSDITSSSDFFGFSIDIEGDVIAVGARGANSTGNVYIWEKPPTGWANSTQEAIKLAGSGSSVFSFGHSLDLRGNQIAVGAQDEIINSVSSNGAIYVFEKQPSDGWDKALEVARMYHPVSASDRMGSTIALADDFVATGASTGTQAGNAFIFEKGAGWSNKSAADAILRKSNRSSNDNFAVSMSFDNDLLVVGSSTLGTFVYSEPAVGWSAEYAANGTIEQNYAIPASDVSNNNFGESLRLKGSRLAVGDKSYGSFGSEYGKVYFYLIDENNAVSVGEVDPTNAQDLSDFGAAIDFSEDNLIVGAPNYDGSGEAYAFSGTYNINLTETICFGETFDLGAQTLSTSGSYNETFVTTDGIDSLVALQLTVNPQLNFAFNFDPIKCNGETGGITFDSPSGGDGGPYEYSVDGTTFQTNPVFSGLSAGPLTLVLRDGTGCTRSEGTVLQEPAEVLITSTNVTDPNCSSTNDGSVDVQVTGGSGGYYYSTDGVNYQFNGATINTTVTIGSLVAGSYTIYIKDGNDCEKTTSVTLTGPPVINFSVTTTDPLCNGESNGSITNILAGGGNGGPFTYSLDGTNFQTNTSFTGLSAGTYIVTVQDNGGCFYGQTYTLTDPVELTATATITNSTSCLAPDGVVDVSPSGGTGPYTYTIDGSATSNPITGLSAGTYSIEITDANGCSVTISESVTEPAGPQVAANFDDPTCFGANDGTISAVGFLGTAPYEYSFDGGAFGSTQSASGLAPGNHTVDVRDANGCIGSTTIFLIEPPVLSISNLSSTDLTCNQSADGSIDITVTGGTAIYFVSLDNVNFESFNPSTTLENLDAGTYTIYVKDLNDCTVTGSVTITEPPAIGFDAILINDVSCFGAADGEFYNLAATGGDGGPYTFSIDGTNFQTTNQFTGLDPGIYSVYLQDAGGCVYSEDFTIDSPTEITTSSTVTNTSTCGALDGELVIAATGGVAPYTFSLNGGSGQASGTFSGLSSGVYAIDVADATGCIATVNEVISDPITATISTSSTDLFCGGSMDGSITVSVSGGTAPYEYSLDGGAFQASNEFNNLSGGSYSVAVREANGCIQTVMAAVVEPDPSLPAVGTSGYTTTYGTSISNWAFSFDPSDNVSTHFLIDNVQGTGLTLSGTSIAGSSAFVSPSNLSTLEFTPESTGTFTFDVQPIFGVSNLACASGSPMTVTITVDPAVLTITADDKSRKYGEANPTLSISYSGFVNGESEAALTALPSASTAATSASAVGDYDIIPSGAAAVNYDFTYTNGTLSISQADLTVTANDKQITFGETIPALDGMITGVVSGDNIVADYGTVATSTSDAGTYPITATLVDPGSKLTNYNVTNNSGTLTIIKADQTISFAAIDDIDLLNSSSATLNATSDAGLPITFSVTQGQSIATISGNVVTVTNTGNVTIEASQAGNTNYNSASASESFSVVDSRKTDQTITFAAIADKTYGDQVFTLGATASSSLSVVYSIAGHATLNGNEVTITGNGSVTITADQDGDNTFNPAPSVSQSFTILPADLTVEASDKSMTYGDQVPTLDGTISGIAYNDNLTAIYSTSGDGTEAGDFSIEATINDPDNKLANYNVTNSSGTLSVEKAALSVTANDFQIAFGDAIPTLDGVISGITNNDNISAVYSTSATSSSDVGEYAVEASIVDPDSRLGNYTVTNTSGKLTIIKAEQSITFNAINSIDIATTNTVNLVANTSSGLAVTFTLTEGDGSIAGSTLTVNSSGNFSVRAEQEGNSNYNAAVAVTQNFQVTDSRKQDQTITFGALDVRSYGDAFTLSATASSELSVTYTSTGPASVSGNEVTVTGVGEVTITASQAGDENFNPAPDVSQSFMTEKVELTATADDLTINEGDAIPTLTITYAGFVNGEDATVLDAEPTITTSANSTSAAGEYTIVLAGGTDENYSFTLVDGTLTIEQVLGLEDNSKVEVYPNPFTNYLIVKGVEIETVEIRNLSGKVLRKTNKKKIDTSELNAGVYLLILKNAESKTIGQSRIKKND